MGSSTPFHSASGASYCLFYDGELSSTGAVGVAIVERKPSPPVHIDYMGLTPFGEISEVTSSVCSFHLRAFPLMLTGHP